MNEIATDAWMRAAGTVIAAVIALPLVAWFEGLRGRSASTSTNPVGVVKGPRGAFTALATSIKLLEKRAPRALETDRLLHATAPVLAIIPTLAVPAIIPLAPHDPVRATLAFALAMPLLSTGAIALAGFGSGSRLAHLAALRLVALRVTVFVVVAAAALAAARTAGSVGLPEIVRAQAEPLVGLVPRWNILLAPTAFFAALTALAIHAQHVLRARTEATLTEPWIGDVSGPVLLGHRIFESLDLLAGASLLSVIFLGGWHTPALALPWALASVLKIAVSVLCIVAMRNVLPTLTPTIALRVCWIVLLPLALVGVFALELL